MPRDKLLLLQINPILKSLRIINSYTKASNVQKETILVKIFFAEQTNIHHAAIPFKISTSAQQFLGLSSLRLNVITTTTLLNICDSLFTFMNKK